MDADDLRKVLKSLDQESLKVLKYFIKHRSVGELIAIRELRGLYRINDPAKCIGKLIDLGLLERGIGCYNVSRDLLKALKSKGLEEGLT